MVSAAPSDMAGRPSPTATRAATHPETRFEERRTARPVEADAGGVEGGGVESAGSAPQWRRRLRRVATAVLIVGLAGAAHGAQTHADRVEQRRAEARVAALGASVMAARTDAAASQRALALTAVESSANDAAIAAREARGRLAQTGVTEADIRATLDASRQQIDAAGQERDGLDAEARARTALIPDTDQCLADALRSLSLLARSPRLPLVASESCARPETGAG